MANLVKLRKGLDINLKGKAAQVVASVKEPGFYALVPDDFTGITPKVVVKEQEYVMAGGPLFVDICFSCKWCCYKCRTWRTP